MVRPRIRLLTVLLMLAFVAGMPAFAQQNGKISGQVTDSQGAAVSGAALQVVEQDNLRKRETKTDEAGAYSVPNLPPGDYQVLVQAEGFDNYSSDPMPLAAGQALVFNIQLVVAGTQSVVTVQGANGVQIELDTAALSGSLSKEEVTSYGLNGRNFSQLITLTPGVSNQTGQDEAKVGVAGSAKFSVNGGRVEYNTFEVDGSDVLNTSINASRGQGEPLMVYPSVDAIQDMQVLTSNYGAQYGKSASGSVLVTTKSGTAKFHGNVYGFIRNEKFNARNYFDAPGRTPLYRRQDYGGTIGGPLYIPGHYNTKKDKTFFFWSEELRLEKTPVDYNQAVPTMAERSGDFTDVCPYLPPGTSYASSLYGYPDCPITSASTGQSSEHVNVSYLSGSLLNSNLIPYPNSMGGCNTTNPTSANDCYVAAVSPATYWREELFRIDHSLTQNVQISFRYIHDTWHTDTLTPQWGIVQNSFPTVENHLVGPGLNMVLSSAQTLPHSFLNRVAFSYAVEHISLTPQPGPGIASLARPAILNNASPSVTGGAATASSQLCSIVTGPQPTPPGPNQIPQQLTECPMGTIFNNAASSSGGKMPGLVFQGDNGAYGGHGFAVDTGYAPWNQANPTFTLRDDVGKSIGSHSLQFGFEITIAQQNELSAVSGANSGDLQGLLTFSNQQSKYTTGNAFADFLGGPGIFRMVGNGSGFEAATNDGITTAIKSFTQDSAQGKYYNRYNSGEIYLQDDWRVNTRLTVNAGVRVSLFGAWYNAKGTAYNWEPQAYSQSVGDSIIIDPNSGELVSTTGGGSGLGNLPIVPLNPNNLDPRITNGLVQCGANGVPRSCMSNRLFNPAPRIGLAWDPTGSSRTSIRAGYGLFWEHGTGYEANTGSLIGSAPLILSETQSFPTGVNIGVPGAGGMAGSTTAGAYNSIGKICTANCNLATGGTLSAGTFPLNVTSIPSKAVYSYTQQWSLSVQRELRKDLVGSLAYVGTKGTHLTATRDLNQLPPVSGNPFPAGQPMTNDICTVAALQGVFPFNGSFANTGTTSSAGIGPGQPGYLNAFVACTGSPGFVGNGLGTSADRLRPYLGFSNIISIENIADSQYHALQGTLRRSKGPLTLGVAYTYSHSLDDASDRASANFADSLNIKSNWASSDFDQRHLLNVSYIYDLPFLRLLYSFTHFINEQDTDVPVTSPASKSSSSAMWQVGPLWKDLLDGWQLSGIAMYQSGSPFSVINGGSQSGGPGTVAQSGVAPPDGPVSTVDNAGVGDGLGIGSYADRAPLPHGTKPVVPSCNPSSSTCNGTNNIGPLLKNPLAFMAPRALTFGDSGRNSLNNPGRTNFNMALLKHFKAFGERDVEFRAEAFNVFNHTQFRIYDPSHPGNTGNNVINCYGDVTTGYSAGASSCLAGNSFLHPVDAHDPRILQFGLKLAF